MQRQTFDAGYVQRLTEFDHNTERDFVSYFTSLLEIKLRSRLRAPDQIQDVIQETFARVLRSLRSSGVENPEALGSFVNSVCNNVLFEFYRSQSRFSAEVVDRPDDEPLPQRTIEQEEERRQVRAVIGELPEKDRTILRWLFFDERDKGEICKALKVDREYLRVLVHRAKLRFRDDYLKRFATKHRRSTPID